METSLSGSASANPAASAASNTAAGVAASAAAETAGRLVGAAAPRPGNLIRMALVIGLAIQFLLYGQPFSLGYALAALVVAGGWLVLGRATGIKPSRSALVLVALLCLASLPVAWRASVQLRMLDVLAGMFLVLLVAALYVPGGLHRLSLTDYAVAGFVSSVAALVQPFFLLLNDRRAARPQAAPDRPAARARRAQFGPGLRGLLLALPLLLVFGALFYAADPVFADYVRRVFSIDIDLGAIIGRLMLSALLAWFAMGLLRGAFTQPPGDYRPIPLARPAGLRIGRTEAITVLGLLDLLFASFVAIQAVYLFGGADTLARSGLTHSEYARRGFFELVAAAALVLSLVLALDWLARAAGQGNREGRERAVDGLHALLVLLTLAILVSALQRMVLYQQEYGLTVLRLYTTAFMGWLGLVLLYLLPTVLAGRAGGRRGFAFGSFVAGLALLAVLNLLNPDALIARTNLARAGAGAARPLDARYLARALGPDAVPVLLAGLPTLPDRCIRAELARGLQERAAEWERAQRGRTWLGYNWGEDAARRALAQAAPALAQYASDCPQP